MSGFELGQSVDWHGNRGEIIGLTTEPSAIIEFPDGTHMTVGISTLAPAGTTLPTEPGLYVEANGNEWALLSDGTWVAVLGIDGIEPTRLPVTKAEPRAVTAKAVLDRVMEIGIPNDGRGTIRAAIREEVAEIAREFGVDQ